MKTAKEMFEDIGFSIINTGSKNEIHYQRIGGGFIVFYLRTRSLANSVVWDMSIIEAVNQQIKELGWVK